MLIIPYSYYTMTLSSRSLNRRDGRLPSMKEITISDRIERFLNRKFRASRSYATTQTYRGTINRFSEFAYQDYNQDLNALIDNVLNQVLDPIEILNDFYTYLTQVENPQSKRIGYSNNSIRQYVTTVKEFLNDCGCKIYNEDIRRAFKLPKKVTTITDGLTKEVIAQIVRLANYKLATAVLIACSSGMRIGEIIQLKISDIDFTTNPTTIQIRAETTKTREGRITHITQEATQALKDLLAKTKKTDYVFLEDYDKKIESLSKSRNATGKLKERMKKKYDGLSSEEKQQFRMLVTKHNFQNQLKRLKVDIPELSTKSENGRYNIHFHAFRYFFKTQVTDAHESDFAEALMGHHSIKLVYYRQNAKKRQKTYLDVEHSLTISETEHIEKNYTELQQDNLQLREELNSLVAKFRDLEERIEISKSHS